jgi:2-amino-4-hydroxy-6-hydroxymethyldihydropteridine diphosphokinase
MGLREESGGAIEGIVGFIGIGSNLGDPFEACRTAIARIAGIRETKLLRSSSLYKTKPVGPQDQPSFINAVAEVRTTLAPRQLLHALQEIEKQMGRVEAIRWGPRIVDLDILFYGQKIVQEEGLVIPHPELHRRAFVLVPLCELASYMIHPTFGVSIRGLMDRLADLCGVEIYSPENREKTPDRGNTDRR